MDQKDLVNELHNIVNLYGENEWIELKEAKTNYDFNKLGQYFSALSNEANLRKKPNAWLVFGIADKKGTVVGSSFRHTPGSLDSLKKEIADFTGGITFQEIYELIIEDKRVIMFKIPPALRGMPTPWKGHYYGRNNESLAALSPDRYEEIRSQSSLSDWSAEIIQNASIEDLDPAALIKARHEYSNKHPRLKEEIEAWDDIIF